MLFSLATSRDIRTTWRSFCVNETAVPEVTATEFDFATSVCEDSCSELRDKFTLLVRGVQSICTMVVQ